MMPHLPDDAPIDPIMDYLREFMKDKVETEEDTNTIDKVFEQLGDLPEVPNQNEHVD